MNKFHKQPKSQPHLHFNSKAQVKSGKKTEGENRGGGVG